MLIGSLVSTIMRYLRYQSQLMNIAAIDDHLLRDIGAERSLLRAQAWERTRDPWH